MIMAIGLTTIALFVLSADPDVQANTAFLARVENTKQVNSQGEVIPRIERDPEGKVIWLSLNRMQLSADDIAAIGRIKTLRYLDLSRTNITNADLRNLCESQGINLCSTEVTDEAIESLLKLPALRSLCLGDVAITPKAVARLKEHLKKQHKRLALGYTRRK